MMIILTAKKYLGPIAKSLMNDSNAKTMVKKILPLYRREFMYGDLFNITDFRKVNEWNDNDKVKSDLHAVVLHAVLIETHEDNINSDAEGDEQLHERVKHDPGHELGDLDPRPAAVQHAEHLAALLQVILDNVLEFWTLVIILKQSS